MSNESALLNRKQLAAFLPSPQAVIAFENLFKQAFINNPDQLTGFQTQIDTLNSEFTTLNNSVSNLNSQVSDIYSQIAAINSTLTTITTKLNNLLFTQQLTAPVATGFTVNLADNSSNAWLVLSPAAVYATGTINFPSALNSIDGQEIQLNNINAVTAIIFASAGAVFVGAPSGLIAGGYMKFKYSFAGTTWYRVS